MNGIITPIRGEDCAILPLVLKHKWYDMIQNGKKNVEYREAKPYWRKRIMRWLYSPKPIHIVAFSRGYRKADMFFEASTSFNTYIGSARPDLGQPQEEHYKIHLLGRVEPFWCAERGDE